MYEISCYTNQQNLVQKTYAFRTNRSLCVGVFFMAHPVVIVSYFSKVGDYNPPHLPLSSP